MKNLQLNRPHRVMLDGMRTGAGLDTTHSKVMLEADEAKLIKRMMRKSGANQERHDLKLTISKNGTTMLMVLRTDENDARQKYLNLSGNPLTFITGSNVYGSPRPWKQTIYVWNACIHYLERQSGMVVPERVKQEIADGDIHLNSLEFAVYTKPNKNVKRVIDVWHWMYHSSSHRNEDGSHEYLADMLNVLWVNAEFKNGFRIKLLNKQRKAVTMFSAYDKATEILWKNREQLADGIFTEEDLVPEDVRDRLRLEISLQNLWFKSKRIKTLRDLDNYVRNHKLFKGDWKKFIEYEIEKAMDQAYLKKMFTFDGEAVKEAVNQRLDFVPGQDKDTPTWIMLSMLEARARYNMPNEIKVMMMNGDPEFLEYFKDKQNLKALHRVEKALALDTSEVFHPEVTEVDYDPR